MANDRVDLWFTSAGDFQIDQEGDLKDTSDVYGRSLVQEMRTRLRARTGDWKLVPLLAADLEEHLGEPGTMANIGKLQRAIAYALTKDGLIPPGDIEVLALPINSSIVLFRLVVQTPRGDVTEDLAYDSNSARFIGE